MKHLPVSLAGAVTWVLLTSCSLTPEVSGKLGPGCQAGTAMAAFTVNAITGPDKGKTLCYI